MAKKATSEEVEAEATEEGVEGEAPQKSGKKKVILVAAAALVLVLAAGGGAFFVLGLGSHKEEAAKRSITFLDIREMTVNLVQGPQQDRPQYLKLKVALELADPKLVTAITPLLPRVEDAFQV